MGHLNPIFLKLNQFIHLYIKIKERGARAQLQFIPFKMLHLSFNEPFPPTLILVKFCSSNVGDNEMLHL